MSCSTFSYLASSTRSSAYFTVWMICPPILKSPDPSRTSLVRHSLYNLNRIGDKHHPCLTRLHISCLPLVWSYWAMYKLLIGLLSYQSIPVLFRICINLVQLTQSNVFCQSMEPVILSSRKRPLVPINQHVCLLTKYVCAVDSNKKEHFWLSNVHAWGIEF